MKRLVGYTLVTLGFVALLMGVGTYESSSVGLVTIVGGALAMWYGYNMTDKPEQEDQQQEA